MTRTLRPLDPDTFHGDMREHVRWHLLLTETDALTQSTGLGLASVWGHIRRGDYDGARQRLTEATERAASLRPVTTPERTEHV